jgi:hypothetical protein
VRRSDFDLDKKAAGLILPIPWKQKAQVDGGWSDPRVYHEAIDGRVLMVNSAWWAMKQKAFRPLRQDPPLPQDRSIFFFRTEATTPASMDPCGLLLSY